MGRRRRVGKVGSELELKLGSDVVVTSLVERSRLQVRFPLVAQWRFIFNFSLQTYYLTSYRYDAYNFSAGTRPEKLNVLILSKPKVERER